MNVVLVGDRLCRTGKRELSRADLNAMHVRAAAGHLPRQPTVAAADINDGGAIKVQKLLDHLQARPLFHFFAHVDHSLVITVRIGLKSTRKPISGPCNASQS